jgi:hypothetical protein
MKPNIGIYPNEDKALEGLVEHTVRALDPKAIWLSF